MAGYKAPVQTAKQLADQMNQPIGTKTLRELAQGKNRVVVTFDDLTRTNTLRLEPFAPASLRLLEELRQAAAKALATPAFPALKTEIPTPETLHLAAFIRGSRRGIARE